MKSGVFGDVLASLLVSATTFLKHCFIKRKTKCNFPREAKDK